MTVESASYISQLDFSLPAAGDQKSEGDDHIRTIKTVLKTQFPNFGTTAVTPTAAEVNYLSGVSSAIQTQLNSKAALASPALTGVPTAPTAAPGTNTTQLATTAFVAAVLPVDSATVAAASKSTPVDADLLPLIDSAASNALKSLSWGNVKAGVQSGLQFLQSGTGAVARGNQDKLRDAISVKDFGAVGNGVADDTTAIQAAVTAAGAVGAGVYFPAGTYNISAAIDFSSDAVVAFGASRYKTLIRQTTTNAKIFNITANFCGVKGLSFIYSGTPASGATAIYVTSAYVTTSDFVIRSCHVGVHFDGAGAVGGKVIDFEILDYELVGVLAQSLNDLFVSRFILNAGNATRGALGGIRLIDKVEAFVCTDGDILLGAYSATMDASVYGIGTRPAYNRFTNVYFDSSVNGVVVEDCVLTEFVGCWFSSGRSGGGNPGAQLLNSEGLTFTNCTFFNNGSHGVTVAATATDITFIACHADSNSVTAGIGIADGFSFSSNATNFKLIGCTSSNGLYTGTQRYGVHVSTGCNNFTITNCDLSGNGTGGLLDDSSATATKSITSNIGVTSNRITGPLDISSSTGGQIVFPATQNPSSNANTLDDYKEGTWTPVLTFATPGNLAVSYAAQSAGYTKIGRLVTAKFFIQTSAFTHTTASGNLILTGLPFTSENTIESYGALNFSGITKATYTDFVAAVLVNTQTIVVRASGSGVGSAAVTAADMPTGGTVVLRGTITYTV